MDAETGLLPREFTYPGIAPGTALRLDSARGQQRHKISAATAWECHTPISLPASFRCSMRCSRCSSAPRSSISIWAIYYLVRKRHGLGFGDIALIAMCGAFLGLKLTLFVLFTAPILGSVFGRGSVTAKCRSRRQGFRRRIRYAPHHRRDVTDGHKFLSAFFSADVRCWRSSGARRRGRCIWPGLSSVR